MVKIITFDLDGTLIDSRLDLAGAVNYMRASFGLEELETERVVSFVGNGAEMLVRRAIADTEIDFSTALMRMKKYYKDHLTDCTSLYPGAHAGLRELKESGIKLAVLSNKQTEAVSGILDQLHVREFFDDVIGGDSDFPLKPAPDALIYLAGKYQFPTSDCWMFGDHYTDLECARHAGWRKALARYGYGDPHEETFDFEVSSFPEFLLAIKGF